MSGIKVPKLGSLRDRIFRQHLTKESELESKKVQFQAMLAMFSAEGNEDRVKKLWKDYLSLEYGVIIPEHSDKEIEMQDFYRNTVSKIKAKISKVDGKMVVSGFENFLPPTQK